MVKLRVSFYSCSHHLKQWEIPKHKGTVYLHIIIYIKFVYILEQNMKSNKKYENR